MSFYDDMAQVSIDLIRQFGAPVTITRTPETFFDPVSGITGKGEPQTFTPSGILKTYPTKLIDGTRITAKDRMLILEPTYDPEMTDVVTLQGRRWSIHDVQTSAPAGTPLVHFLQVRS